MRDIREELVDLFKSAMPEGDELVEVVYVALSQSPEDAEGEYNFTVGAGLKNGNQLRKQMLTKAMEVF